MARFMYKCIQLHIVSFDKYLRYIYNTIALIIKLTFLLKTSRGLLTRPLGCRKKDDKMSSFGNFAFCQGIEGASAPDFKSF